MPTYEYECKGCGHQFEIEQRITADRLTDCPQCKQSKLERLISATAFTLKGGGWYKDGYGTAKSNRTENQVTDRLTKAIDDDKKKTAEAAAPSSTPSTAASTTATTTGSGSGSTSSD